MNLYESVYVIHNLDTLDEHRLVPANPHRHGPWLHHLDVIQGDAEALNQWTRGQPYGDAVEEFVG